MEEATGDQQHIDGNGETGIQWLSGGTEAEEGERDSVEGTVLDSLLKAEKKLSVDKDESDDEDLDKEEDLASDEDDLGDDPEDDLDDSVEEIPVPAQFNKQAKEDWEDVPYSVKQELARRNLEQEQTTSRFAQQIQTLKEQLESKNSPVLSEEVDEILAENYEGEDKELAVKQLLEFDHLFRQSPLHAIHAIAKSLNKSPTQLMDDYEVWVEKGGYAIPTKKLFEDKKVDKRLEAKIAELENKVNHRVVESFKSSLNAWINGKDESGEPLAPYYEDIEDQIVLRLRAQGIVGDKVTLEAVKDAYEKEIYANKETRARVLAKEKERQIKSSKQKWDTAKSSERSLKSSRRELPEPEKVNKNESALETLQRAMSKLSKSRG
jgi:hypothetical protein